MNENETYHNDITRVSKSGLDQINKTPRHYQHRYFDGGKTKPTKPMLFGSAFHSYILEREKFNEEFIISPIFKGTGSREKQKQFEAEHNHKSIVSPQDMKIIMGMEQSIQNHPIASKLINKTGIVEKQSKIVEKQP